MASIRDNRKIVGGNIVTLKNKVDESDLLLRFAEGYSKAVVTGGAGFIGSHLCDFLVRSGVEVICLDDFSAGYRRNIQHLLDYRNFRVAECDVTDRASLSKIFDGVDIVFHNAAAKKTVCLVNPLRDLEVNAGGTLGLLEVSYLNNVKKFVHASTGSVYGEPILFPQDEEHPCIPVSYYGISKLAGERYVNYYNKTKGLNTTILRYYHVYGERQESNEFGGVVSIFIRNMINGEKPVIYGDGSQERSFTYVKDVVKANILSALEESATGQIYNCASSISVTIEALCSKIIACFDMSNQVEPSYGDWVEGDIKKFDVDNSKICVIGMEFETDFFSKLEEVIYATKQHLREVS